MPLLHLFACVHSVYSVSNVTPVSLKLNCVMNKTLPQTDPLLEKEMSTFKRIYFNAGMCIFLPIISYSIMLVAVS